MAGYRQSNPDRAKAALAALIVHVAIGAAFLAGLVVNVAERPSEVLSTFDVAPPPPPTSVVERPSHAPAAKEKEGKAAKKAEPSPLRMPDPEIELKAKPTLATAPVAGAGAAATAGATVAGRGSGAGGSGSGRGGGGTGGDGAGFTPARKVTKIPDREYRRIIALSGSRRGRVGLTVRVGPDGAPRDCRIIASSGTPAVDSLLCELTLTWVRFQPARDPAGRPVAQDISWFPDWSPR